MEFTYIVIFLNSKGVSEGVPPPLPPPDLYVTDHRCYCSRTLANYLQRYCFSLSAFKNLSLIKAPIADMWLILLPTFDPSAAKIL